MWVASSIDFFKRYNLLKKCDVAAFLSVLLSAFIWDALTGWHSWSVDLVLPIMSVSTLAAMFVIAKVRKCPCARVSYLRNYGCRIRIDSSGNLTLMQSGEKSNSKYVWSVNMFPVSCSSDIV